MKDEDIKRESENILDESEHLASVLIPGNYNILFITRNYQKGIKSLPQTQVYI